MGCCCLLLLLLWLLLLLLLLLWFCVIMVVLPFWFMPLFSSLRLRFGVVLLAIAVVSLHIPSAAWADLTAYPDRGLSHKVFFSSPLLADSCDLSPCNKVEYDVPA